MTYNPMSLDIDDVICDFTRGFFRHLGLPEHKVNDAWKVVRDYYYSWLIPHTGTPEESLGQTFTKIKKDEAFWLGLPVLETYVPKNVEFYLTSRECPNEVTKEWLRKNGFPNLPLINAHEKKLKKSLISIENGMSGHIDDKAETFTECISAGLNKSFLVSRPWNVEVETTRRIYKLEELDWRL